MLQLILGPAHSGKTDHVYQCLRNRLEEQNPSWVLVPEQFSLSTEKEILTRFGLPSQTQIRVLTFSRLCNLVFHACGPLRMAYIDGAGKHLMTAEALHREEKNLTALRRNLRQNGFVQILTDTFSECKRYGVSPEALSLAAEETRQEALSSKLKDLSLLYQRYNQLIEAHHADAEDNLTLACPRIGESDLFHGALFVLHFRSFTPVEYLALGELMKKTDLTVVLDHSDDPRYGSLFAPAEHTIRQLCQVAEDLGVPVSEPLHLSPPQADNALSYLQQYYFDYRAKPCSFPHAAIHSMVLRNRYREAEAAADLILRLCRTRGDRFRDFLILARDTTPYLRILPAIFQKRGISLFLDLRQSIIGEPLVRLLCGMLEILAYGHSYERVMTIARTELFPLSRDDLDQLENYILATAPSHAMWQTEIWDYQPEEASFDLSRINHTKNTLLSGVTHLQNTLSGTKTGGEIAAALLDWLRSGPLAEAIQSRAESAMDEGNAPLADTYRQVWNSVLSLLSQWTAVMDQTPMTYRRFSELFAETCQGIEIGQIPQTLDCVVFSRIDRFRSSGAKTVLVLDLNDGIFPKGHSSEGFLSDGERQHLLHLGLTLAPGMEQKRKEEQLLLYAVLNAPKEDLYLLRSLSDNNGNLRQPSSLIKRVCELFPTLSPYNPDTDGDDLADAEGAPSAFSLLAAALSKCGGHREGLTPPMAELYHWFSQSPDHRARLSELESAMTALPPEAISKELAKKLYGAPLLLSASQLETYNACAFRYFLNYGLLVRERQLAGIKPRNMGNIQHAALYRYFTDLAQEKANFAQIDREDCFRRVGKAVEEEAKKNSSLLYEASAYYQYMVLRMKDIASRTAWEVVKFYRSTAFQPYGYEVTIGKNGEIPALSVRGASGEEIARIRGLIDRADVATVGDRKLVSIVDYKSSAKALDVTLAKDGITLQPLLYSGALCHSMKDSSPAAMFYLQMNDPILKESDLRGDPEIALDKAMKPKGWIVNDPEVLATYAADGGDAFLPKERDALISAEELNRRMDAANEKIRASAQDIADGKIGAHPYCTPKHDACQYCSYYSICQHEK